MRPAGCSDALCRAVFARRSKVEVLTQQILQRPARSEGPRELGAGGRNGRPQGTTPADFRSQPAGLAPSGGAAGQDPGPVSGSGGQTQMTRVTHALALRDWEHVKAGRLTCG